MKRKTNLFYNNGDDSKFITFSNYTESLTGNFLSTDTKIFPSRFLCLKINGLNKNNKPMLIKYLSSYYENKLAFLRDKYLSENKNVEHNIYPFNYLLEALYKIKPVDGKLCDENNNISVRSTISNDDETCFTIEYVSDITEQDYNGTYTDTICIVDLNNVINGDIHFVNDTTIVNDVDVILSDEECATLSGWTNEELREQYIPIFDDSNVIMFDTEDEYDEEHAPHIIVEENESYLSPEVINLYDNIKNDYIYTGITIDGYYLWRLTNDRSTTTTTYYIITEELDLSGKDVDSGADGKHVIVGKIGLDDDIRVYDGEHTYENSVLLKYIGSHYDTSNHHVDIKYDDVVYHVNSYFDSIILNKLNNITELQFNCIIPLFDVVDINYKSNFTTIVDIADDETKINLCDDVDNNLYTKNVPLGMWFYADEDDETFITLKRSNINEFSPSWSLVISSQFKPFPYSNSMPDDFNTNAIANSFATFSQVLTRQNDIMDSINKLLIQFNNISNRIGQLEGQMKQIGTSYNIDGIHQELINYERGMNNKFNDFKTEVTAYLSNLRWHTTI